MEKSTVAILFAMMALNATATANTAVETRNVPRFSAVTLNGISTVRIHQGPQAVRINIDADLIDRYESKVQGETLFLGFKCSLSNLWALKSLKTCEVDITMPELKGITMNGEGKIIVDEFAYQKLELHITGNGVVELNGTANELTASCTGNCRIIARDLISSKSNISITGSSRFETRVTDSLNAAITGAGKIIYWGKPEVFRKILGAGTIQQAND